MLRLGKYRRLGVLLAVVLLAMGSSTSLVQSIDVEYDGTESYNARLEDESPSVMTRSVEEITPDSALLRGKVERLDRTDKTEVDVSFYWREINGGGWNELAVEAIDRSGSFYSELSGLDAGTRYEFYASIDGVYGVYNDETFMDKGSVKTFRTQAETALWQVQTEGDWRDITDYQDQTRIKESGVELKREYALQFDGQYGNVNIGSPSNLEEELMGDKTISMWLSPKEIKDGVRRGVWDQAYWEGGGTIIEEPRNHEYADDQWLNYFYGNGGDWSQEAIYGTEMTRDEVVLNEWYHVVLVRDLEQDKIEWWIEGERDALYRGLPYNPGTPEDRDLLIGDGDSFEEYATYYGRIDDFRIYNRSLSQTEIEELYENKYQALGDEAAWWPMNEGTGSTVYDRTDGDNHGDIIGADWVDHGAREEGTWSSETWYTGFENKSLINSFETHTEIGTNQGIEVRLGVDETDDGVVDNWNDWQALNDGENKFSGNELGLPDGYGYKVEYRLQSDGDVSPRVLNYSLEAEEAEYTLGLYIRGGEGTVEVDGEEVNTPYEEKFMAGEEVDIEAVPDEHYEFSSWEGDYPGGEQGDKLITIMIDENKSVTAYFEKIEYGLTIESTEGGEVAVPGEGTFEYEHGEVVELEAAAHDDYRFVEWTGDNGTIRDTTSSQTTMEILENYTITAVFELETYTLTVDSTEGGEVIQPGEGSYTSDVGTVVDLEAVAGEGYHFVEWTGDVDNIEDTESNDTTIEMSDDCTITAEFQEDALEYYELIVNIQGEGYVEVDGVEVEVPYSEEYEEGTRVGLRAVPDEGWKFNRWTGAKESEDEEINLTMDENKSLTANFNESDSQDEHELTLDVEGEGAVELDGAQVEIPYSEYYPDGTEVELTAVPDGDWQFSHWLGDCPAGEQDAATIDVMMDEDRALTAYFENVDTDVERNLTINVEGDGTTDPEPGVHTYYDGEAVSVTAIPEEGWTFNEWTGDYEGAEEEITVVMDSDKTVTAHFEEDDEVETYALTINVEGGGTTYPDPGKHLYPKGEPVMIEAIPDEGRAFDSWTGDYEGTEREITITMDSDKEVTAHFYEPDEWYEFTLNIEGDCMVEIGGEEVEDRSTYEFGEGEEVSLEALPEEGWEFSHWSGDVPEGEEDEMQIAIAIDGDKSVTAHFDEVADGEDGEDDEGFLSSTPLAGSTCFILLFVIILAIIIAVILVWGPSKEEEEKEELKEMKKAEPRQELKVRKEDRFEEGEAKRVPPPSGVSAETTDEESSEFVSEEEEILDSEMEAEGEDTLEESPERGGTVVGLSEGEELTDEEEIEKCPFCGAEVSADSEKCPLCGETLVEEPEEETIEEKELDEEELEEKELEEELEEEEVEEEEVEEEEVEEEEVEEEVEEVPREEAVEDLKQLKGIGTSKAETLYENGYQSIDDLKEVSKDELKEVKGIGPALSEKIIESIETFEEKS
ncbi:MAG: LamG-like jellyroll fold domain-containing protein [Candidatus Thermoplasmatota archaeon]